MAPTSKSPMTAAEAIENVSKMKLETQPNAMKRLLKLALGPFGNLSEDAVTVYKIALKEMEK